MAERDFNEVWGDKEAESVLEAIAILAEGKDRGLSRDEVGDILSERLLVVPGDNQIAQEQLESLEKGYETNPEGWDAILGRT